MIHGDPLEDFKHTTAKMFPGGPYEPNKRVGVVLVDEKPGFTGIYIRDGNGDLWPARTVSHKPKKHHESVIRAWLESEGEHQDRRSAASICKTAVKKGKS